MQHNVIGQGDSYLAGLNANLIGGKNENSLFFILIAIYPAFGFSDGYSFCSARQVGSTP